MLRILRKYLFSDREFYHNLLSIGVPIAIQNLLTSALNLVDTLMVGQLGEQVIASVGAANQFYFILNYLMIGVAAGSGIFISQFLGKKDSVGMRQSLGVSIMCSLSLGGIFMLASLMFPRSILRLFQKDPIFVQDGCTYLQIVCLSYPVAALTHSFASGLKNSGKSVPPLIASAVGVSVNIILNYLLIFGKLGAPALGISGAALATLSARIIELLIILFAAYGRKSIFCGRVLDLFSFNWMFFRKMMTPISHTVGNEMVWTVGMVACSIAYGKLGVDALAISQIYSVLQSSFSVLFYGIASTAIVLVGQEIGRRHSENAYYYGKRMTLLSAMIAVILACILLLAAPLLAKLFHLTTPALYRDAVLTIRNASIPFVAFGINTVLITGVLRGAETQEFLL